MIFPSFKNKKLRNIILAVVILIIALGGIFYIVKNRPSADTETDPWAHLRTRPTTSLVDKLFAGYDATGGDKKWGTFENYTTDLFSRVESNTPNLGTRLANRFISDTPVIKDSSSRNSLTAQFWVSFSRETQGQFEALTRIVRERNNGVFSPEAATEVISFFTDNDGAAIDEIADNFNVPVEFTIYKREDGSSMSISFDNGNWSVNELGSAHTSEGEGASADAVQIEDLQAVGGDVGIINFDPDKTSDELMERTMAYVKALEEALPEGHSLTNEERQKAADYFIGMSELLAMGENNQIGEDSSVSDTEDGLAVEMIREYLNQSANEIVQSRPLFRGRGTIEVNPATGNPEYTTVLCYDPSETGQNCVAQGYLSFDPQNNTFSAEASAVFGGKNVALYSDPLTGDVYMAFSRADEEALYSAGRVQLMSAMISKDGHIGGTFRYGNRMFRYNPSSSSFEVPIAVGRGGAFRVAQEGDRAGDWGTVYIDSKGNVTGRVDVLDGQASVFLDRTGRITVAANITSGGQSLGSIGINTDGQVSGSIDVGRAIGTSNIFVSFGSGGISGVTANIGSFMGNAVGIGISSGGGLSLGTFVPVAGIPIPIGIGQSSDGGFRLVWPGGSLGLFGGDSRPQRAPELAKDSEGNIDAGCIYFRHSFKKLFQTVRVYQVPCTKIAKEEQVARSQMIFDVYNALLDRNPGLEEFTHWYFYSGHQLYQWPKHENDKEYRMSETEAKLRKFITGDGDYARAGEGMQNPKDNRDEYRWIQSGKAPLDAPTRPTDILEANPFDESTWQKAENTDEQTGETRLAIVMDFLEALLEDMKNDPGHYLARFFDEEVSDTVDEDQVNIDYDISEEDLTNVETVLVTRQGDYPVIEKTIDNKNLIITLRKGFNEIFVPEEVGYVNTAGAQKDGLKIFEYDTTISDDPSKSWNTDVKSLKPGTGYYIHNSGDTGRKIRLAKRPTIAAGEKDTVLKKGWNLLSHSGEESIRFSDYQILAAMPGWSGGCDVVGLCVENKKMSELILTEGKETRVYSKVHFLVPDTDPLKLRKLVEADLSKNDNLNKIELRQGQMFWVYLFE